MITHARLLWPTVFRTVPGFFQSRPFHSDILRLTHGSSFSTNYFVLGTQKEMPPQLGTLDRSRPPVFALQSVRCYRVKKDTNMTSEEEFICKVRVLYCIVFIHFYSASHSLSLSEALPTTAIDTVSEFTRRSATGNCR